MEIIEIICWGEIQILFGSWPNLTWHVCGGTTQPGLPGAVFGRVDDHDRGDKTRTSIEGRPVQLPRPRLQTTENTRRWRLKKYHGGRDPSFSTSSLGQAARKPTQRAKNGHICRSKKLLQNKNGKIMTFIPTIWRQGAPSFGKYCNRQLQLQLQPLS